MCRNVNGYRFTKYHWWYKRSRDGAQRPGFDSRTWCHMWVEFVVGSRPCSKDSSFSESSGFPPSAEKKQTNKQAKNKKTIQIRPGSRGKKNHLVEWPLLNSHSLPIIPVVFRVVCTNSASSSIQMVERRATIKEVEGLGLRPDLHQGSKDLNDRGEFIANYLTFNSSLVRTPNRGVVSCTFAVMACPLQTVEHQVLGDVICRLFTGVAQKIFFVPLPLKYISKRKLAINQKVN